MRALNQRGIFLKTEKEALGNKVWGSTNYIHNAYNCNMSRIRDSKVCKNVASDLIIKPVVLSTL